MELQECVVCEQVKECIHHHVSDAWNLTFPMCRSCHRKIHLKTTVAYMGYSPIDDRPNKYVYPDIKQLSIKLPPTTYTALVKESEKREGLMPAPTRTARPLIEERLKQIDESD